MARQRDYRAEYARRIERGLAQGLSRSQARGHPRPGEAAASRRGEVPIYERVLEGVVKAIRVGEPLGRAARRARVAPERARAYLARAGVAEKRGGRWRVLQDIRRREVEFFSRGRLVRTTLPDYESAATVGRYLAAVRQFFEGNDPSVLEPFEGASVTDVRGRRYMLETDPDALYRLAEAGVEPFEQVYRIVT
jgi:hypothetical protein